METETAQTVREILSEPGAPVIIFDHVQLAFDDKVVLRDVSFTLVRGHTKVILGASGSGKSTALKIVTGLLKADSGVVWVNGERIDQLTEHQMMAVRADLGMIFQEGALFDSLTVRENVGYKLYEESDQPIPEIDDRVKEVLGFVGLIEHLNKMPSELSGGQRRRVAIARAMAVKPRILLYDEPTTGLDPVTSAVIDELMIRMRKQLGVTSVVITHDMRSAYSVGSRIAMLYEGRVRQVGTVDEIRNTKDPVVRQFIEGRATLNEVEMAGVPASARA
jgi:phospholipid/cholesterol/gamma-HCH transport system ATP-binding protein